MKSAPKTPDPYELSKAQHQQNLETAQATAKLGMSSQDTAYGSVRYVADPSSPSGYRVIQDLSPEQRALLEQGQKLQGQYGQLASDQVGRVSEMMATPFDMSAARGREISDIQRTLMDPQWSAQADDIETTLLNRGIRPGSEAYNNMMRQFGQQRSDAYNKMYLDAYNTANNAALIERNMPLTDLQGLGGSGTAQGVHGMDFMSTPQPTVANTDLSGNVWNAYNAKANQYNQQMQGIYSLAGSAMGAMAMSDIRVKRDITKIDDDPRGWGVYTFRYLNDDAWHKGFMAQEVMTSRPDAVHNIDGVLYIDYGVL